LKAKFTTKLIYFYSFIFFIKDTVTIYVRLEYLHLHPANLTPCTRWTSPFVAAGLGRAKTHASPRELKLFGRWQQQRCGLSLSVLRQLTCSSYRCSSLTCVINWSPWRVIKGLAGFRWQGWIEVSGIVLLQGSSSLPTQLASCTTGCTTGCTV